MDLHERILGTVARAIGQQRNLDRSSPGTENVFVTARAVLNDLNRAFKQEGLIVAPRKATQDMVEAGYSTLLNEHDGLCSGEFILSEAVLQAVYEAVVASAPNPLCD